MTVSRLPEFIARLPLAETLMADEGYDSEELRRPIVAQGSRPSIPRRSNSKIGNDEMDWTL